jgi:hypothetical protein
MAKPPNHGPDLAIADSGMSTVSYLAWHLIGAGYQPVFVVDSIAYVPLDQARAQLNSRVALRADVEAWWSRQRWGRPSLPLGHSPIAILARQIATFRYEDGAFVLLAEAAGLEPAWFELASDLFSRKSPFKLTLVRPRFCSGRLPDGTLREEHFTVEPATDLDGPRVALSSVQLSQDCWPDLLEICSLPEFHHRQLFECHPSAYLGDNTAWLSRHGDARSYYLPFLSLFVAHCILFENFSEGESNAAHLGAFRARCVEPAWRELVAEFGVEPLVVRMPWRPELALYPANASWRSHGVIPDLS